VYEDLNPKIGQNLDFLEFFEFLDFLDFIWIFLLQNRILDYFRPNFLDFLEFFGIFSIFGIDFLGCTNTFLSGQPLEHR